MEDFPDIDVDFDILREAFEHVCTSDEQREMVRKFIEQVETIQNEPKYYLLVKRDYEHSYSSTNRYYLPVDENELEKYQQIVDNFKNYCGLYFKYEKDMILSDLHIEKRTRKAGQPDCDIMRDNIKSAIFAIPSSSKDIMKKYTDKKSMYHSPLEKVYEIMITDEQIKNLFNFELDMEGKNHLLCLNSYFVLYPGRSNTWYIHTDRNGEKIRNIIVTNAK